MDNTILSFSKNLSFFLSFFSDIEVWPKKVRFFSLAPTSARPVLVECFSGRFSYLCVNFIMHYLPFSVNCTYETYTV